MATKPITKNKKKFDLKRTPVIAVLGHVDHGKTSLLDVIRNTNVQGGEAGGITQNVRAHQIEWNGQKLTFIDTPGHEAFSAMRSRGAHVTDIVLLVIAADDSIQPQTKESIEYAKAGKIPLVIAINKTDMQGANPQKVRQDLLKEDIQVEEMGGEVIAVEVSAKKKKGIDDLLEAILITAEMSELKKDKPKKHRGYGVVLESTLDDSLGPISLILIKSGIVQKKDYASWEEECGRVRCLKNEYLKDIEIGEQSDPVWITGLQEVIDTGVEIKFYESQKDVTKDEKECEVKIEERSDKDEMENEDEEEEEDGSAILASILNENIEDDIKKLNIILRADVKGTLEVAQKELDKLSSDEVKINILESSTGDITERDLLKAKNSNGVVIGFKVGISEKSKAIARREKVIVMIYDIIYEMIDEVNAALEGMLESTEEEIEIARAKVKKVFELSDKSKVAGSKVQKGTVLKGYRVFVEREGERIGDSKIKGLRHGKEEVREALQGTECGILLDPQIEVEEKDEIVCYKVEKT